MLQMAALALVIIMPMLYSRQYTLNELDTSALLMLQVSMLGNLEMSGSMPICQSLIASMIANSS